MSIKPIAGGERRTIYFLYFADFLADFEVPASEEAFLGKARISLLWSREKSGFNFGLQLVSSTKNNACLGFIDAVCSVRRHIENERVHDAEAGAFAQNGKEKAKNRSRSIGRVFYSINIFFKILVEPHRCNESDSISFCGKWRMAKKIAFWALES